jgi:succinate dehydrogenase hydrophobic anchor subunit
LKRILLKVFKFLLYVLVLAASCGMGIGINYLTEKSEWFLFLILAAIIIAVALLFGVRIIIDDRINPSLER